MIQLSTLNNNVLKNNNLIHKENVKKPALFTILKDDFKLSLRGYNRQEVNKFLIKIKENYQELLKRNKILSEEVERLEKEVRKYKEKEDRVEEALISAQRSAQLINESSNERAKLIIKEAELRAKKITENGEKEYNKLEQEIISLKRQKRLFLTKLKSLIKAHSELLEFYEDKLPEENTKKEIKLQSLPSVNNSIERITFDEE